MVDLESPNTELYKVAYSGPKSISRACWKGQLVNWCASSLFPSPQWYNTLVNPTLLEIRPPLTSQSRLDNNTFRIGSFRPIQFESWLSL